LIDKTKRNAEVGLKESEDYFHRAFNNAPIGIAIVALDGHYMAVNFSMSTIVGYSQDELLKMSFQDIAHPGDLADYLISDRQLLGGEASSYQMEKRYLHKLGHGVMVLLNVSLIRDTRGNPLYFISQIQDITERNTNENRLNEYIKELETVAELTSNMRKVKDSHAIAMVLLNGFLKYLKADSGAILTLSDDKTLEVEGVDQISESWVGYRHPRTNDPLWQALISKESIQVFESVQNGKTNRFYHQLTSGYPRILILPLRTTDGDPVGLLLGATSNFECKKHWNTLANISEMGSNAINRVKGTEQAQRESGERIKEIDMLQEAIRISSDVIEPEKAIGEILEVIIHGYDVIKGGVYVKEGESARLICSRGVNPGVVEKNRILSLESDLWHFVYGAPLSVTKEIPDNLSWAVNKIEDLELIAIPISVEAQKVGLLCLLVNSIDDYDQNDLLRILLISKHFGAVLTRQKLNLQTGEDAIVEERRRLARDLHDSVTQLLYSLVMYSGSISKYAQSKDWEEIEPLTTKMQSISTSALREMRLMIYQLRPEMLEISGLQDTLYRRLEAVEGRSGIKYELFCNLTTNMPPEIENGLYNIIQEALNNILKHSNATKISVRIEDDTHHASVEIVDNGVGFNQSSACGGVGLSSMKERVEKMGGRLDITSTPNQGTRVRVQCGLRKNFN
jgi:PAS domain S-box-containing protein